MDIFVFRPFFLILNIVPRLFFFSSASASIGLDGVLVDFGASAGFGPSSVWLTMSETLFVELGPSLICF